MIKNNVIRFCRKYGFTPAQLAGKDFEIESISTDQGMFDRRSCDVRLTVNADLFKLFNGSSGNIKARVTLSDGTVYVLSDLCQMSQMPVYDYFKSVDGKFTGNYKTKLIFGNWQVYLPHKDEICSTSKYDCEIIDLEGMLHSEIATEAVRQMNEEIIKNLGIDLGSDKDNTATTMVRAEELKRIQAEDFANIVKEACEKLYRIDLAKPIFEPVLFTTPEVDSYIRSLDMGAIMPKVIKVELPSDKKDVNDLSKEEFNELIQNANKEKEKDNMKINNKELKQIIIDEDRKTVTVITETPDSLRPLFGLEPKPTKYVTYSKASDEDEFDKYVGVALALAYQKFGSKEEFHKFVRESELINDVKKNKEAKAATKEAKKKEAQEAHEKAVARKAKQAQKDEETATELLEKLAKFLNKPKKTKKTKTEKSE